MKALDEYLLCYFKINTIHCGVIIGKTAQRMYAYISYDHLNDGAGFNFQRFIEAL